MIRRRTCIILALCLFLLSPLLTVQSNGAAGSPLSLKVELDGKNAYLLLRNVTSQEVRFYNQWKEYDNYVPTNVDVALRDSRTGKTTEGDAQRAWRPGAKRGSLILGQPFEFDTLSPNQQIRLMLPVSFLKSRIDKELLIKSSHIKVSCTVYHTDNSLDKYVSAQSRWLSLDK